MSHRFVIVAFVGASLVACGDGATGDQWIEARSQYGSELALGPNDTPSSVPESEKPRIEILRRAIAHGLTQGRSSLTGELRAELSRAGVVAPYVPTDRGRPVPIETTSCPFLAPASGGQSVDCRAVVTRATVSAYARSAAVRAADPLDDSYALARKDAEFWAGEGYSTGVDNEATAAIHDLRSQHLCDQSPSADQSAHEAGVANGRRLYIDQVNARFAELGIPMHYPDAITQITQCTANTSMLEPARARALEATSAHAITSSLCSGYHPATPADVAALDAADRQFAAGMTDGIAAEHSLAAEAIFRVVPCNVGDPLVLDLGGDGVHVVALSESRARFDLFGTGQRLPVAWVRGDDALLALDKNGNGVIDDGHELFGNFVGDTGFHEVESGFSHLALYDRPDRGGDGDGKITANDAIFAALVLWRDDGDGVSRPDELFSLARAGVVSIDLATGSMTRARWAAAATGGGVGEVADVWLEHGRARVFDMR